MREEEKWTKTYNEYSVAEEKKEAVNHPSHYSHGGIEAIDVACSILSFDDMYELIDNICSDFEQNLDENSASKARAIIIKIAEKYV